MASSSTALSSTALSLIALLVPKAISHNLSIAYHSRYLTTLLLHWLSCRRIYSPFRFSGRCNEAVTEEFSWSIVAIDGTRALWSFRSRLGRLFARIYSIGVYPCRWHEWNIRSGLAIVSRLKFGVILDRLNLDAKRFPHVDSN